MVRVAPFAAVVLLLAATPVFAHARLIGSDPAAEATIAPVATMQLHFSERLTPAFSGIDLVMTDMPGMKMRQPMKMPVKASVAADGTTLVGTLPKALPRGTYRLEYHVVSADTHRVEGGYGFVVK